MSEKISATELQIAADQCVKCAVCLPHCPTYALSGEEAESPRGRITLLQGIVYERLETTPAVDTHLNNCLNCGRCEQVCPAKVPYTRLLDGTRALVQNKTQNAGSHKTKRHFAAWLLSSPRVLGLVAFLGRTANTLKLGNILGKVAPHSTINRWLNWIGSSTTAAANHSARPTVSVQSEAWLFSGCLTDAFEQELTAKARTLARAHGVNLTATPAGLCCGALYQHLGDSGQTQELTARTIEALSANQNPVVVLPSGCSRGLVDGLGFSNHPAARETQTRITELFTLLDRSNVKGVFSQSDEVVGLYAPCSFDKLSMQSLSGFVSQTVIKTPTLLQAGHGCCGAAGDHMLSQPLKAERLASPIVDEIASLELTHVLVPNTGCAWHLRANLEQRGLNVTVEHPVSFLERHLSQPES